MEAQKTTSQILHSNLAFRLFRLASSLPVWMLSGVESIFAKDHYPVTFIIVGIYQGHSL